MHVVLTLKDRWTLLFYIVEETSPLDHVLLSLTKLAEIFILHRTIDHSQGVHTDHCIADLEELSPLRDYFDELSINLGEHYLLDFMHEEIKCLPSSFDWILFVCAESLDLFELQSFLEVISSQALSQLWESLVKVDIYPFSTLIDFGTLLGILA